MSNAELIESDVKFTEKEAAQYLQVSPQTLCVWRCTKRHNIPFLKIGRNVRYRLSDLKKFLEDCTVAPAQA